MKNTLIAASLMIAMAGTVQAAEWGYKGDKDLNIGETLPKSVPLAKTKARLISRMWLMRS